MDIAVNTDFLNSVDSPEPYLKLIAEAGFTHLHWCHHWCGDFSYDEPEVARIGQWLKEFGLRLLDIHGSSGSEKCWYSDEEYRRQAGVKLVRNRIRMFQELEGSGTVIMHIPHFRSDDDQEQRKRTAALLDPLRRSLDELMPDLESAGVRIAVENLFEDTFEILRSLMDRYPESLLGITYDSGHANIGSARGLEEMEKLKHRLQALHLHDNDRTGDLHQPPFMGDIDWERTARMIASSSYLDRPLSFEIVMANTPFFEPDRKTDQTTGNIQAFLEDARRRGERVIRMVERHRAD